MIKKKATTGIRRIINAGGYSINGFTAAFKHEAAFRQELAFALVLMPIAIWFGETNIERAILVASLLLVLIVELMNTAIEATVDRIGPEQHALSGRAKDVASAAVLLSLVNVVIIWAIIFLT
ncbi:MAG: diacylglycerol kinase [Gammaproteobacteria bacterium]|nr:diacylglycerol kinase [Gammaproteobacteria bacterium]